MLELCFGRSRFPGSRLGTGSSEGLMAQSTATVLASGPHSLRARRSRKVLPRPDDPQVPELGQSPAGERGPSRKCWAGPCLPARGLVAAPSPGGREMLAWPEAYSPSLLAALPSCVPRAE